MKKAILVLLATLMLLMAACSNGNVPSGTAQESQTTASQPDAGEAERLAKEEAERLAKEEEERLAKEEAERLAKEEEERLAKEEAERLAMEEQKAQLMTALQEAYDAAQWRTVKKTATDILKGYPDSEEARTAEAYMDEAMAHIEEAGQKALAAMRTDYDKVEQRTWYYPTSAPKYTDDRNCFYIYFGQMDSGPIWLRCVANYTGDDWIFFESLIYSIDGHNTNKSLTRDEYYRDNAYGNVWEVADYGMGGVYDGIPDADRAFLERIIESEETVIRFVGDLYHYDHTVTQKEKEGLVQALAAFDYLFENK